MSNGNRIESMDQNDNNVCLSSSLPSSSSSLSGQQQTNSSNNNNNGGIHQMRYSFQKQPFVIGVAGGTASGKVIHSIDILSIIYQYYVSF